MPNKFNIRCEIVMKATNKSGRPLAFVKAKYLWRGPEAAQDYLWPLLQSHNEYYIYLFYLCESAPRLPDF